MKKKISILLLRRSFLVAYDKYGTFLIDDGLNIDLKFSFSIFSLLSLPVAVFPLSIGSQSKLFHFHWIFVQFFFAQKYD